MPSVKIAIDSQPAFVIETYGWRDSIVSKSIARYRRWDDASTGIIRALLRKDADFVDIGANIGWFTLVAAHTLRHRGTVHSFEPDPRHIAKLRAGLRKSRFDNVIVNAWALGDRRGTGRLYRSATNFGDHRLFELGEPRRSVNVPVETLDDYGRLDPTRPLVIKLDVQGFEARVLQGAQRTLASHHREIVMLCEASPRLLAAAGSSLDGMAGRLAELGFLPALIDSNHHMVHPMTWDGVLQRSRHLDAALPSHEDDLLLYRRLHGMVAPVLAMGRS